MDRSIVGALVAIGIVALVGLLARRGQGETPEGEIRTGSGDLPGSAQGDAEGVASEDVDAGGIEEDDDDDVSVEVVAVTSDGYALVPDTHAVRFMPPQEEGEGWKAGTTGHSPRGQRALDMSWHAGDFTGGRVVRGAADEGPWRFEALGRDGEYAAFVFETREGADAALGLFQSRGVIRLGHDDDGNPAPPSPEQFEEARRIYMETEAALDHDDEGDDAR